MKPSKCPVSPQALLLAYPVKCFKLDANWVGSSSDQQFNLAVQNVTFSIFIMAELKAEPMEVEKKESASAGKGAVSAKSEPQSFPQVSPKEAMQKMFGSQISTKEQQAAAKAQKTDTAKVQALSASQPAKPGTTATTPGKPATAATAQAKTAATTPSKPAPAQPPAKSDAPLAAESQPTAEDQTATPTDEENPEGKNGDVEMSEENKEKAKPLGNVSIVVS